MRFDLIMLKNAIRLAIAGYLFDGETEVENEIEGIPQILEEMAQEYKAEIKNQLEQMQLENEE